MTSHLQNVDLPVILRVSTTQYTGITDIQGEIISYYLMPYLLRNPVIFPTIANEGHTPPPEVANMGFHRSPVRFQQNSQKPPVQLQGKKKPTAS